MLHYKTQSEGIIREISEDMFLQIQTNIYFKVHCT